MLLINADREIKTGEEIFINYGFEYWRSRLNIIGMVTSPTVIEAWTSDLIRRTSIEELKNTTYIQQLIYLVGTSDETLKIFPSKALYYSGGLHVWLYPNQFSEYLLFLSNLGISSYLEIGSQRGGIFIFTIEYLNRFHSINYGVAISNIPSPVLSDYINFINQNVDVIQTNSDNPDFSENIISLISTKSYFDMVFIDGDYSYDKLKRYYNLIQNYVRIVVIHNIINDMYPDTKRLWSEIKDTNQYEIHEFIEQYIEVFERTGKNYLGIGVAIKKSNTVEVDVNAI